VKLIVTDREGVEHEVEAAPGGTLMEVLRGLDYGVTGVCGGMCSCATCHVYVDPQWRERLPEAHSDEREVVGELTFKRPESRLSCQVQLVETLDGLRVTIAPEE